MLFRSRRPRREGERGQILVMFTLVIVLLMALTALVIDVSLLRNDGARLQNALDSGALAASQGLPANSANIAGVKATAVDFTQRNFAGVAAPSTAFACLIGVTNAGLPRVADMPAVCRVSFAANSPQWKCTDVVCWAPCDPAAISTDICNTIILSNNVTRQYTFGRAIGVNSGNTGTLVSAACSGACGGSLTAPVDVVLLLDRTGSMDQSRSIRNLRNGGDSVLTAFNPTVQRVALGFTGPSSETNTTDGYYGTDATSAAVNNCTNPHVVHALALDPDDQPGPAPVFAQAGVPAANVAAGANSLVIPAPTGTAVGNYLIATVVVDGDTNRITGVPTGWNLIQETDRGTDLGLATYGRFATATDTTAGKTYTFNLTNPTRAVGGIVRYTGVDTGDPIIDNDESNSGTTASTSLVGPAINVGGNSSALVAVYASDSNTTFPPAAPVPPGPGMPTGFTERIDATNPNTAGPNGSGPTLGIGTATGTGNIPAKTAKTVASARWAAQLIGLRGADVPGEVYGTNVNTDMAQWIPIGFSGTDTDTPAVTYRENFVDDAEPPNVIHTSHVAQAIDCFDVSQVGTNLARPLYMATKFLADNGRPNIKRGIILETDGAPENGGNGPSSDYTNAGVLAAANAAKAAGIEVFTVGYGDVDRNLLASMATTTMPSDDPGYRTTTCDTRENTDGDHFFCLPLAGDLSAVLHQAALQLTGGSRLVQLYPRPLVTSVSPTSGPPAGGTTITVNGKYFTEAYSVTFDGVKGTIVDISDTVIHVKAPAGALNAVVHIQVSTPGGTSATSGSDQYTYR